MNESPTTRWEKRPRPKPADDEARQRIRRRVDDVVCGLEIGPVDPLGPLWTKGARFQCECDGTVFAHKTEDGLRSFVARLLINRLRGWAPDLDWSEQGVARMEQLMAARSDE